VAMDAIESGITIFKRITNSFAPSMEADSKILLFIPRKKFIIITTLNIGTQPGRINDQILSSI